MKLIGQYDSPFVRRVGVAMRMMELRYEHLPWSVFADADKIADHSPLLRVPVLVVDDGQALTDSWAIIDYLETVSEISLWPADPFNRRSALSVTAIATGLADKAVSLVYERVIRTQPSELWVDRCRRQIQAAADWLEASRLEAQSLYLFGPEPNHADIAVAAVWRFLSEANSAEFHLANWPALRSHSELCEARPEFVAVQQAFFISR